LRQLCDAAADRWLLSLPGVGPKTSAIVRCFAFGRPAIPVDTHVYRTSRRLGLLGPKVDEVLAHRVLRQKVRAADAFRFHTLLIQHGRNVCRAPKPRCAQCNVQDRCRTFGKLAVE
jgi:endonuclease-3